MEVKINREIRNYTESMFFGLSMRQFFFSVLGCLTAVVIYFSFKESIGLEATSWLCMIGAAPFIAMGFIKYNELTMEELAIAWIRSELLVPKQLKIETNNIYYEAVKQNLDNKMKEELKK